jgi:hypothetical protein
MTPGQETADWGSTQGLTKGAGLRSVPRAQCGNRALAQPSEVGRVDDSRGTAEGCLSPPWHPVCLSSWRGVACLSSWGAIPGSAGGCLKGRLRLRKKHLPVTHQDEVSLVPWGWSSQGDDPAASWLPTSPSIIPLCPSSATGPREGSGKLWLPETILGAQSPSLSPHWRPILGLSPKLDLCPHSPARKEWLPFY